MQNSRPYLEIKHRLDGSVERYECLPVKVSAQEAVVMYQLTRKVRVDDLILPAGSLSFGYFWSNRNYNIYHWVTKTGETLGTYFNVCDETHIGKESVSWRDLIIDILVTPDGHYRVLDADELPLNLDEELASLIEKTVEHLSSRYRSVIAKVKSKTAEYMIKDGLVWQSTKKVP